MHRTIWTIISLQRVGLPSYALFGVFADPPLMPISDCLAPLFPLLLYGLALCFCFTWSSLPIRFICLFSALSTLDREPGQWIGPAVTASVFALGHGDVIVQRWLQVVWEPGCKVRMQIKSTTKPISTERVDIADYFSTNLLPQTKSHMVPVFDSQVS